MESLWLNLYSFWLFSSKCKNFCIRLVASHISRFWMWVTVQWNGTATTLHTHSSCRTWSSSVTVPLCPFQAFPVHQYSSGGMSGYPNPPLQYPTGPQQRCAPSPSYSSGRMPLMGQYSSGSLNPAQFPSGAGQPNPLQYYKVMNPLILTD